MTLLAEVNTEAVVIFAIVLSITVFVLALWGFADNWLRPKAPAA